MNGGVTLTLRGGIPFPARGTSIAPPATLALIVKVAVLLPCPPGVNTIPIEQEPASLTCVLRQPSLTTVKSALWAPPMEETVGNRVIAPVFVSKTLLMAVAEPCG